SSKAGRKVGRVCAAGQKIHWTAQRSPSWHKVRLFAVVVVNQPEKVPAQPEIHGQSGAEFPIVVQVQPVVVFAIIGQRTVGGINLGEIVGQLNGGTDLIGGQERVAAQSRESVDSKCRKAAIFMALRNALNTERARNIGQRIRLRGDPRSVQVIQSGSCHIDQR